MGNLALEEMTDEQIESEAKTLGWASKDKWRGAEDEWADARTFLERGRAVTPILRENNKRLMGELTATKAQLAEVQTALKSATAAIKALESSHEEDVRAQVEAAKESLIAELAEAHEDGDHKKAAKLTAKLTELNAAEKAADDEDEESAAPSLPRIPPEVQADIQSWFDAHPKYKEPGRHQTLANMLIAEKRQAGDRRTGSAILDDVAREVEEILGGEPAGKVSGGSGGGGRTSSREAGRGYAALPAEAKAACDKLAARLVGPNRAHKDMASWQASYAKQYFENE